MNAIQLLASQPWVERLGAALLHFLWQGALIAVVLGRAKSHPFVGPDCALYPGLRRAHPDGHRTGVYV